MSYLLAFLGKGGIGKGMISQIKILIKDKIPFIVPVLKYGAAIARHSLSRIRIKRIIRERKDIFLELGAGDRKGVGGWVTIDITDNCDIFWDLRKGLPFPDESIAKIYSSHFFEHLSFREIPKFLDECKRVLIPGGTFSICVPNARLYIEAYLKSDCPDEKHFGYKPAYNKTTSIDYINYMAYMDGNHKYMFDEENLIYIIQSRGFRNTHLRLFDPGLDLEERAFESIYAEAQK